MRKSSLVNTLRAKKNSGSFNSMETGEAIRRSAGLLKQVNSPYRTAMDLPAMRIPVAWNALVPSYRSKVHGVVVMHLLWDSEYAEQIKEISQKRTENRISGYINPREMERAVQKYLRKGEASIRFGGEKRGHGYSGERGDFCLVGGVVRGKNLSLFYRSLELIGGFAYDLTLIKEIQDSYFDFNTVTIFTTKAFTFALKDNSNEKLFPKLQEIFRG